MKKKPAKKVLKSKAAETLSLEKKKRILGVLVCFIAVILLLSIVSYNPDDMNNLAPSTLEAPKAPIHNIAGVVGVHIANFFVVNLLGYFSALFPIILFVLGISFFKKLDFKKLFINFNLYLLLSISLASFFGLLNISRLAGSIGFSLSAILNNLLGYIGAIIFLSALVIVLATAAFDFKIENVIRSIKNLFVSLYQIIKDNNQPVQASEYEDDEEEEEEEEDNKKSAVARIKKIKELNDAKKKKKKIAIPEELLETEEALAGETKVEEETKIRILRNDELRKNEEEPVEAEESLGKKEKKKKLSKKDIEFADHTVTEIQPESLPAEGPVIDIEPSEKEIESTLPHPWEEKITYKPLSLDLLEVPEAEDFKVAEEELKKNAELLKDKLKLFDIIIEDIAVTPGPVVTLYEIKPAPGVKISKIVSLEHDIALALAARGIRIIAPIPGKSAIGVEIPNAEASIVKARSVLAKIRESKLELPIAVGKQINGEVLMADLAKMPHLLVAGSTGSGKSVGINMIITSLLYSKDPSEVKFLMIDPKKIELSFYNKLRRHYLAICPDLDEEIVTVPQNAVILLKSVEIEMEKRYDKLAKAGVRNIIEYNNKVKDTARKPKDTEEMKHFPLPYLVVIVDELADLMITAGREVEEPITRLAQLARAVGIHLVLATQRPSVNVITGVIKANFSARVAYQVASKVDSRTILDMNGAEQLLGRGDMLFLPTGSPKPIRIQNAYISTEEVEAITAEIQKQPGYSRPYPLPSIYEKKKDKAGGNFGADFDPMFEEAARVIVRHQQGSVSLLQRRLKLGYSRAARIVDQLEEAGIVGPNDGSKARTVLIENDEQLETIIRNL